MGFMDSRPRGRKLWTKPSRRRLDERSNPGLANALKLMIHTRIPGWVGSFCVACYGIQTEQTVTFSVPSGPRRSLTALKFPCAGVILSHLASAKSVVSQIGSWMGEYYLL